MMPMLNSDPSIYPIYLLMRNIGRIAFPIFAFLIVEGFIHTNNYKKYLTRILIFALVSQVPFNLCFGKMIYNFEYWRPFTFGNIGWTFTLALMMLFFLNKIEEKELNVILKWISYLIIIFIFMALAYLIKCDRRQWGILVIAGFYLFRRSRIQQLCISIVTFLDQRFMPLVFLSLIPIGLYNGEKGKDIRKFVYGFYPVHLLVIGLINLYL